MDDHGLDQRVLDSMPKTRKSTNLLREIVNPKLTMKEKSLNYIQEGYEYN